MNLSEEKKKELVNCIKQMETTAADFYRAAVNLNTHHHQFVEFTGFMNEYIKCCLQSLENDMDFTQEYPIIYEHNMAYIAEKFECIFGHATSNNKKLQDIFVKTMGWAEKVSSHLNSVELGNKIGSVSRGEKVEFTQEERDYLAEHGVV